ncbi:DUF2029 domain-containing protein [Duganella sp. FT94W]|uniref:DUF2029 domain-containing protein n=1 Tax=Duganella lactea TaxID=2692173 RepID=A0ABW9VDY0_9BURK|nr:glycosyltransferase 87 family protein [Duganella lactea]MYM37216.1 DUF2029 domain-containing protein [Duganella lactea]
MNAIQRSCVALDSALLRTWQRFDRGRVLAAAALILPLLFGLVSLSYGQDDNWDLHNYHHYTPYALLNGKIGYDLAPGQWQSYFNPTLDLVYYGLNRLLPPAAAGFAMGWLHGLNVVLLLAIGRLLLPAGSHRLAAVVLALAGCLGPGFMSELGNTMGDNLTALTILGGLLLLLRAWPGLLAGRLGAGLLAGLLVGAGTGLKLTNAVYALALCLAMLALPMAFWLRLRLAFVFGVGVLGGIAASAGHWYWRMWQVFGNPLFPQFNDKFQAPLAAPIGIGDTGWIPKGLAEKVLWPFIFTLNPKRVIEIQIAQLIWPILYLAFAALVWSLVRGALLARPATQPLAPRARYVLLFFALAYLGWLNLFGIYRYLVPLELLAPLVLWLVLHRVLPPAGARPVAVYALLVAGIAGLPHGNWGHANWTREGIHASVPAIAAPRQSMVLTVHGDPPMSWLVPSFPRELAFVALGGGFPESPAYAARMAAMMAERSGPFYVMMTAQPDQAGQPESAVEQARQRNAQVHAAAAEVLARYRLRFDAASCVVYDAAVGTNHWPYQLCRVNRPG